LHQIQKQIQADHEIKSGGALPVRALLSGFLGCRDIKPENLLIGGDGEIRMSDFGWSVISTDAQSRTTLCGTTDYLAPEMLNRSGHGTTADIWCLGVLCYELLYGKPPFEEESLSSTCARIRKVDFRFPEHRKVCETFRKCEGANVLL
jgi:serine/threonine protein kinase